MPRFPLGRIRATSKGSGKSPRITYFCTVLSKTLKHFPKTVKGRGKMSHQNVELPTFVTVLVFIYMQRKTIKNLKCLFFLITNKIGVMKNLKHILTFAKLS